MFVCAEPPELESCGMTGGKQSASSQSLYRYRPNGAVKSTRTSFCSPRVLTSFRAADLLRRLCPPITGTALGRILVFSMLATCTSKPVLADNFLTDPELVEYVTANSERQSFPEGKKIFLNIRMVPSEKVKEFSEFISRWFKAVGVKMQLSTSESDHSLHMVIIPERLIPFAQVHTTN